MCQAAVSEVPRRWYRRPMMVWFVMVVYPEPFSVKVARPRGDVMVPFADNEPGAAEGKLAGADQVVAV